jgi:hypothetical protein
MKIFMSLLTGLILCRDLAISVLAGIFGNKFIKAGVGRVIKGE